jgi:lysophospholipase L1-like esterase
MNIDVSGSRAAERAPSSEARRGLRRRLALLALGISAGLSLGELGLRLLGVSHPVFDDYDPERAIILLAGKEGTYHNEGRAYLKINAMGYRDVDHDLRKPPDTFRIAVLGDSFTEARQVALENTFAKLLEAHLRPPAGKRVEVLNFGVGSYGTAQELITLRRDALRFAPDLVLLVFFPGNDVCNNSQALSTALGDDFRPFFYLDGGQLRQSDDFRRPSLRFLWKRLMIESSHHSRLLEVLNQGRHALAARDAAASDTTARELGLPDAGLFPPRTSDWRDAWTLTERLIEEAQRSSEEAGARFALATATVGIQVDPRPELRASFLARAGAEDPWYAERRLEALGRRRSFPVITLGETLQAIAARDHVYLHGFPGRGLGQGHWNEAGHQAAAAILLEALQPMLDADPAPAAPATRPVGMAR